MKPDSKAFDGVQLQDASPPHVRVDAILYLPASQMVHEEPASEVLPAAQFVQAVEDVDPEGEVLPAAQLVHRDPAVEYVPARQSTQAVEDVEPEGEALPAAQGLQAAEPDAAL
jgi:hypothetical protein